ncbi:MAG: sigma-70 family RNA polymerase sigma factor [Rhodopirellula sp. JB044]|uniref:sigma-70 family RNA polymerase sigma factor n=1 Tax=Rhodopirellula sp. JB044 TaxID=3342844 RepID=UPI00370CED34
MDSPNSTNDCRSAVPRGDFVALFARENQRIYAYIYTLLPNRADADDVFQSTSLTLWEKFDEFDRQRDFFAWACGIAFFKVKNFRRTAARSRLCFNDELLQVIASERAHMRQGNDDRLTALDQCIKSLLRVDRELIARAYDTECSIKEVAEELGRAVQTIYNRLNIIRRGLVHCVDKKMQLSGADQ